jgi:nucleotide-binding universal stress UspA family protein
MVRRILIAFDFSRPSMRAVQDGVALAQQLQAEAVVVTVLDVADLRVAMKARLYDFRSDSEMHGAIKRWITEEDQALLQGIGMPVRRVIRRGIPEQGIVACAARMKADLIVVGSTGITRRLPLGGVAREVLRRAKVPVVVVK